MKTTLSLLIFNFTLALTLTPVLQALPTIGSFAPKSGAPGESITISGSNFSTPYSSNEVFFGIVEGTITAGGSDTLTVTIPPGAEFGPLLIFDNNKNCVRSDQTFVPSFSPSGTLSDHSFAQSEEGSSKPIYTQFETPSAPGTVQAIEIVDFDGDGLLDILVLTNNISQDLLCIYQNVGTDEATIDANTFNPLPPISISSQPDDMVITDLNLDGKPDIALSCNFGNELVILENTSSIDSFSVSEVAFPGSPLANTNDILVGYINGDCHPDLITYDSIHYTIWLNEGLLGSITPDHFTAGNQQLRGSFGSADFFRLIDLNKDGLDDLLEGNRVFGIKLHRNITAEADTPAFSTSNQVFDIGVDFMRTLAVADIDLDGDQDIITDGSPDLYNQTNDRKITFYLNTTSGFSLDATTFYNPPSNTPQQALIDFDIHLQEIEVADYSGDGLPDLILVADDGFIYVGENLNQPTLAESFASFTPIQIPAELNEINDKDFIATGDLNGDDQPDLVTTDGTRSFFVSQNHVTPLSVSSLVLSNIPTLTHPNNRYGKFHLDAIQQTDGTKTNYTQLVSWTSDATETVEVNDSGFVIAHQPGEATITATLGLLSVETQLVVTRTPEQPNPGAPWHAFTPNFAIGDDESFSVLALAQQSNEQLLVAGKFSTIEKQTVHNLARFNSDGTLDTTFSAHTQTSTDAQIRCIALQDDGKILIGGAFSVVNEAMNTTRGIARLNPDGSLDSSFSSPLFTGDIYDIEILSDGDILISGAVLREELSDDPEVIMRLNPDGSRDGSFDSVFKFSIAEWVEVNTDNTLFVGGDLQNPASPFTQYGVIKLEANGGHAPEFDAGVLPAVHSAVLQSDGKLIIVGEFARVHSEDLTGIARLNTDGSLDTSFTPAIEAQGDNFALALRSDGKILISSGGSIQLLDTNGSLVPDFENNLAPPWHVHTITLSPTEQIWIGGGESNFAGTPILGIARLHGKEHHFGSAALVESWFDSTTWGAFNVQHYPWIYHKEHGWLYISEQKSDILWTYDVALQSWLWITPKAYSYLFSNNTWYFYITGSGQGGSNRWFYNLSTDGWARTISPTH